MKKMNNYPIKVNKEYTFAGVVSYVFDIAFENHAPSTRKNYKADYNNRILPRLGNCPIGRITREQAAQVVDDIAKSGNYDSKTLNHFSYLIEKLVITAVENGFGRNEAFCPSPNCPEQPDPETIVLAKRRRSLSAAEEQRLFLRIMKDPKQEGELMGLALMFCLGFRNNEACALSFSDIRPMDNYPEIFCAWLPYSTEGRTRKRKPGGKTGNASRKVPVPSALVALCKKRLEYIRELVRIGAITLAEGQTVESLPIACKGALEKGYRTHCRSEELTAKGKEVLTEVVGEAVLSSCSIQEIVEWENLTKLGVPDRDPTAYLLRRNYATRLYHLDLSVAETQYIMGHKIEDPDKSPRFFSDEEQLRTIANKLAKRTLVNVASVPTIEVTEMQNEQIDNITELVLSFANTGPLKLDILAAEPGDTIEIEVSEDGTDGLVTYTTSVNWKNVSNGANIYEEDRRITKDAGKN